MYKFIWTKHIDKGKPEQRLPIIFTTEKLIANRYWIYKMEKLLFFEVSSNFGVRFLKIWNSVPIKIGSFCQGIIFA